MNKDYSIKNTTEQERRRLVQIAIGFSELGGRKACNKIISMAEEYIVGNIEIDELEEWIHEDTIKMINEAGIQQETN